MKRALTVVLVLVLALMLVSVGAVGAKAPGTSDRTGEMDLEFNLGFGGPGDIAWIGTIEFDHGIYAIAFFFYPGHASEVVSHWAGDFEIYEYDAEEPCFAMPGGVLASFACGDPLLVGHDKGITHLKNLTWLGNGSVDEAYGPFAEWDGRNVQEGGDFTFYPDIPAPHTAEGTLRFN